MLGKQDAALPRPKQPPDAPASARAQWWHACLRKRRHLAEHTVKLCAIAARTEAGAVHFIHGSWGELKATALMTAQRGLGAAFVLTPTAP